MEENSLIHVQRLAEQLSPYEQARLLSFLAHRVSLLMPAASPVSHVPSEPAPAWEAFFRLGDTIAAMDTPESDSMTAAVLAMQR